MPRGRKRKIPGDAPAPADAPVSKLEKVMNDFVDACQSAEVEYDRAVSALKRAKVAADSAIAKMTAVAAKTLEDAGEKMPKVQKRGGGGHKGSSGWAGSWPCCGSKSKRRHKNSCKKGGKNAEGKLPPERDPLEDEDDEDAAPAVKTGRAKKYACLDGDEFTSTKTLDELKDGGCPHCGSHSIVEKA